MAVSDRYDSSFGGSRPFWAAEQGAVALTHGPDQEAEIADLHIPGANSNVVQVLGKKSARITVLAVGTGTAIAALVGEINTTDNLTVRGVDHGNAVLVGKSGHRKVRGNDIELVSLSFVLV